MTNNQRAKDHLTNVENTLNNLSNIPAINNIITKTSLDLYSNLNNINNNLFVDVDVIDKLRRIGDSLDDIITRAQGEISTLHATLTSVRARNTSGTPTSEEIELDEKIQRLLKITGGTPVAPNGGHQDVIDRQGEYNSLLAYANYFNIGSRLNDVDLDITIPAGATRTGIANINQNLDDLFKNAPGHPTPTYTLCDDQGQPITFAGGNYTMQIGGQTATLDGIDLTTRQLDLSNLTINPPNINFPQTLNLSINATYSSANVGVNRVNLVCNKQFTLQLRDRTPLDEAGRQGAIDTFNATAPGDIVQNELNIQYRNKHSPLQREAVFEALQHADGDRFNELLEYGRKNDKETEIKEEIYQQIYNNILRVGTISTDIANINVYDTFRDRFANDDRDRNRDQNIIGNSVNYQHNLNNILGKSINDYIKDRFKTLLTDNATNNLRLKTELSSFLTSIETRKRDDETNIAGRDISQAIIDNITARDHMTSRRRRFLGIPFGRRDINYMRHYNGASHEITNQSVDITTNSTITALNNPEPIKYDMKLDIAGKNNINIKLNFLESDNRYRKKELELKRGEVSSLARTILNCPDIADFKVRAHIVYNLMVGMIKIAKKKHFSLNHRIGTTQKEIVMDGDNIRLDTIDDTGGTRTVDTLFDYERFLTSNTYHEDGNSRSLQVAIDELMYHFNYSMNQYHEGYRQATRRRLLRSRRLLRTSVSNTNFWLSPAKTIMNLRTTRNFDFEAHAGEVSIEVKNNRIALKKGNIEISGRNLARLLEHREKRIRIFDGIDRDIIFAFYDGLTKKLMENSKISRSNFAVRDPDTQNIYVLDEDGDLGVISPEDPNNILGNRTRRIIPKRVLDDVDASGGRHICSEKERQEIFRNPIIMGNMIKSMNRRLYISR